MPATVPSIRVALQTLLVERLAEIDGWTAAHRGRENDVAAAVHAIVFPASEDKTLATIDQYQCNLRVEVLIVARIENTDPTIDDGNAYRYLDRLVAEAEAVIHAPDTWGSNPAFTDVHVDGHEVGEPDENNELVARLFLTFKYRHSITDPGAP